MYNAKDYFSKVYTKSLKRKMKKPQGDNYAHSLSGFTQNINDSIEFLIYISAIKFWKEIPVNGYTTVGSLLYFFEDWMKDKTTGLRQIELETLCRLIKFRQIKKRFHFIPLICILSKWFVMPK